MKVLFVGDIFGKPGRNAVRHFVPRLREQHGLDLCIGNSENVAAGSGMTMDLADELFASGLDLLTSGNHAWSKREAIPLLKAAHGKQLRPANYPGDAPGRGHAVVQAKDGRKLGVLNLEGRVFMKNLDCPFRTAERLLPELRKETALILVDMHCEASSEKNAMGHFLDGKVSAVLGTHTHIQTADNRVLAGGTAYTTDVGMCGPWDSVIGVRKEAAIERMLTQRHVPFEPATREVYLQGAIVDLDDQTGKARSILRVQERLPE
ncbi:MAG TPA: TIGR00282 family metallophosphoesterase [Solirubrobacterales bacterium]|nr:TIGR00282 family metallophosphoesterase [Solirubrobacterales bacterium]